MSEQGFPVTSRFRILDTPIIQPGKCACCGAVDRPVVDFDTTIPLYGAVLLCFSCTQEAARGVDMVDRRELTEVQENLAQTLQEQLEYAGLIGVPRERYYDIVVAVGGLSDALLFGDPNGNVVVARSDREVASEISDVDATDNINVEGSEQSDSGSSEQNDNVTLSERPTIISSGSGDGKSIRSI